MRKFVCVFSLILLAQGMPIMVGSQEVGDPIDVVLQAGLMAKDANGNFNAEGIISRAELASILVRTFQLERRNTAQKPDIPVPDVEQSFWGYNAIQTVLKTGTMSGYRDGLFFPNQRVTRAEALAIFAQAYGVFQLPEESVSEILAAYPDAVEIPTWARKSMATALYEKFVNIEAGSNKINPLKPMTRWDMAYILSRYLERQTKPGSVPDGSNSTPAPIDIPIRPVSVPGGNNPNSEPIDIPIPPPGN
ncbi:S-layer protein [Oscillatoriales cyanobacterium USR001]|nr:S-layer protein [Oscillatoriales cyanobacterium USR001]